MDEVDINRQKKTPPKHVPNAPAMAMEVTERDKKK
jgi:hypothetical protein